jgi:hypothetical protein
MKQRLLILNNASWPTLPVKINDLAHAFYPEIQFSISAQETHFATIPFKDYGDQKRIDDAWIDEHIVPPSKNFDVVAFIVPKNQWLNDKYWGFKLLGRTVPVITITAYENEVWQTKELKKYVSVFQEGLSHELAHYFYGLTPDVQDATHDLLAIHGEGKWLPHFLNQWTPPAPRESEEATKWQLFMQTLAALLSTFGLTKKEEELITETVAEKFPEKFPEKPVPPIPRKSRVEELAHSMEMIETGNQNPKTLGVRYNNPGCLKYSKWQTVYGSVPGTGGFAKFPTYSLGKQAQLRLLRSAMTGRMIPYYRPTMTIDQFIRVYASSSPEIEKVNYVRRVCEDLKIPKTTIIKTLL